MRREHFDTIGVKLPALRKVTMKLMVARLDLGRARSNQHRHHWTNNVGLTNYLQEESNDERQYGT